MVAYNLIPCACQGPNKAQVAHSNLGNSGKFTYKSVGRVVAIVTLVRVSEPAVCLNPTQAGSNPKSVRILVLPRVLLDQMSPTLPLSQILLFLLEGLQLMLFLESFPILH